jgi:hypothetical protein
VVIVIVSHKPTEKGKGGRILVDTILVKYYPDYLGKSLVMNGRTMHEHELVEVKASS